MKAIKKYSAIVATIFLSGIIVSCDSFLEQVPDNRTELVTKSAISEILVSAYPENTYIPFCEIMSDNAGDKYGAAGLPAGVNESNFNTEAYFWKNHTTSTSDSPDKYWNACYKAIAHANLALEGIRNLGSTEDLLPLKGEAMLARAYSHFMLVNLFAKQYNPTTSKDDMGIPYVIVPENQVFVDYTRDNVASVYEKLEVEIEEAIKLIKDNEYQVPKFHFTSNAAHAFASRFYLYYGKMDKVVEHATAYLGASAGSNLRDWMGVYKALSYENLKAQYTKSDEKANILLSHVNSQWQRQFMTNRFGLNQEISDELYPSFQASNRSKTFRFAYSVFGSTGYFRHIPKFNEFFNIVDPNAGLGYPLFMAPLFTAEEVLFNRAEANIMLGNYDKAIVDVDQFHKKRLESGNFYNLNDELLEQTYGADTRLLSPFYAMNDKQKKYTKYILDLRRREFVFEGMRWFDIRRMHLEIKHSNKQGEEETLTKDDLRREIQIPLTAVSNGIKPNLR